MSSYGAGWSHRHTERAVRIVSDDDMAELESVRKTKSRSRLLGRDLDTGTPTAAVYGSGRHTAVKMWCSARDHRKKNIMVEPRCIVRRRTRSETGITLLVDDLLAIRASLTLLIVRLICRQGHSGLETALCTTRSAGDRTIPGRPCSSLRPLSGEPPRPYVCSCLPTSVSISPATSVSISPGSHDLDVMSRHVGDKRNAAAGAGHR